jgi:hypothetical protein
MRREKDNKINVNIMKWRLCILVRRGPIVSGSSTMAQVQTQAIWTEARA